MLPFLKRPCPWCGVSTLIPPAMPFNELAIRLELPCGSCAGGVRARSGWVSFGLFVLATGGAIGVTRIALAHWLPRLGSASLAVHASTAAAWAAAMLVVSGLAAGFLVSNSALQRGQPPGRVPG